MRKVSFRELREIDFSLRNIYGNTWYWRNGDDDNYTAENGRPDSTLHYLLTGTREYWVNGELVAQNRPGELVFIPCHYRYLTKPIVGEEGSFGFNFGFDIFNEQGELLMVDEPFRIVKDGPNGECYNCLRRVDRLLSDVSRQTVAIKACVYELMSYMCRQDEDDELSKHLLEIEPAVRMIRTRPEVSFSTQELCGLCQVSESTFRRKFAEFSGGLSPLQYRHLIQCEKAEQLYRGRHHTLEEIAIQLGFYDVSHLCRVYKQVRKRNFRELK